MSLRKNFLYNTIYQIFIILLPIITVPYVSRVLEAEGVGLYSYTSAYAQYFVLLGMVGISLYGNRQIAYNKHNKKILSEEFWNIYGLQFITTIIAFILYLIIFVFLNDTNKLLYLVQSVIVLTSIFDISWFFIGYEDMRSVVIRNTIVKFIGVLCVFIFVKSESDVIIYALIMAGSNFIGQVIMWLNVSDKIEFVRPNTIKIIKHLKPSMYLFISQLAIQIYTLLDKTMLGFMTNISEVGLYENSQKTIKIVLTLVTSLGVVMMPRMSVLFSEGKTNELKGMIYKAFSFVNFMAFPMVLGLIAISDSFSNWFYGEYFTGVGILLKFGSILILAIGWSNILGMQVMLPMKMEKQFNISVILGAVVNVILNILIINRLQALGTTIASVLAEFTVTGVQLYFLRDFISLKELVKTTLKPLFASIMMFIIIVLIIPLFKIGILWTAIEVFIGSIVYIIIMYIFKDQFLKEAVNLIKNKFL